MKYYSTSVYILITLFILFFLVSNYETIRALTGSGHHTQQEIFSSYLDSVTKTKASGQWENTNGVHGILSPDGNKLAYTITENEPTRHFVKILNLETKVEASIFTNAMLELAPVSWSNDAKFVTFVESSHYVGGLRIHLISTEQEEVVINFPALQNDVVWLNSSELLFFSPNTECVESSDFAKDCKKLLPALTSLNLSDFGFQKIEQIDPETNPSLEVVYRERIGNEFNFTVRKYIKNNGIADLKKWKDASFSFDEITRTTKTIEEANLKVSLVKPLLPKDLSDLTVVSIEENITEDGQYLVLLSSKLDDTRHYFGIFDNKAKVFTYRGKGTLAKWKGQ